jgi:hypothetical protein
MQILGRKGGQGVLATVAQVDNTIYFEFTLAEGLELEASSYLLRNGSRCWPIPHFPSSAPTFARISNQPRTLLAGH